jgi:hypothetical protein
MLGAGEYTAVAPLSRRPNGRLAPDGERRPYRRIARFGALPRYAPGVVRSAFGRRPRLLLLLQRTVDGIPPALVALGPAALEVLVLL